MAAAQSGCGRAWRIYWTSRRGGGRGARRGGSSATRSGSSWGWMFQGAVSSHDWKLAESLILLALDSIWFLHNRLEVEGITGLITKIVGNGASDFTRAALRTSFLASCVSACQSNTMSLTDFVNAMAQRLHERLQECNGDEVLKAEAGANVQKFTEWTLKCIGFHSCC